jgi:acetyl-CoA carboxylase biotin carboxyl carrier protein
LNLKEILELIDKVADRGIAGVEIEQAGTKVRIEGKTTQPQVIHSFVGADVKSDAQLMSSIPVHALPPASSAQPQAAEKSAAAAPASNLHIMTSPIVGTFYSAPSPDADPFVRVGDRVKKGQVLCIIEAMKLMNEIESDVDGTIREIYPQDAQAVEFGEPLFGIEV